MKNVILNAALFLTLGLFVISCNDDDDFSLDNSAVKSAFSSMYPEATKAEWEMKFTYYVAEFKLNNFETEAWFDTDASWVLTETDLNYATLPDSVVSSFEASEYATWKRDDIDMLERPETAPVYIIEVESGNTELDLYYAENGELMKTESDSDNTDRIPAVLTSQILSTIETQYPDAAIADVETEDNNTLEVLINDNGTYREVYFDTTGAWLYTTTEIKQSEVPASITEALSSSEYASYSIDDVEILETEDGEYYLFELESGNTDVYVKISQEGVVSLW